MRFNKKESALKFTADRMYQWRTTVLEIMENVYVTETENKKFTS